MCIASLLEILDQNNVLYRQYALDLLYITRALEDVLLLKEIR